MEQSIYIFVFLFIGLLVGAAVSWLVQRERISTAVRQTNAENQIEIARLCGARRGESCNPRARRAATAGLAVARPTRYIT
jgi:hypothetical protein